MARAKQLAAYRDKRNFDVTPEPRGDVGGAERAHALRFVVQKHAARRLHFDLRLEVDGVFRSWALTRGPSLDPRLKRLAMQTEDHPLAYGEFEGTIPPGEYGGGTVQIWDRGHWQPLHEGDPGADLAAGKLDFVLAGTRLAGAWTLVRMATRRRDSKRAGWLLIKRADEFAAHGADDALLALDRSVASGRDLRAIARGAGAPLTRHPAGAPARRTTVPARAASPEFVPLQLCKLVDHPPAGTNWVHEIKFDGYRLLLRVANGVATLRTRSGLDWSARFPALLRRAARLRDCVLDGEIVALDATGAANFTDLQAALAAGHTDTLVYFAFDLLFDGRQDLRKTPLEARKAALRRLLGRTGTRAALRYVEHFATAGEALLRSACRLGLEGIVSKRVDAPYRAGRDGNWTKAKCRAGQEVVIGGWASTAGRFRSLLVGVHRGTELVYAGRVGSGFSARLRALLEARLREVASPHSPFSGAHAPRDAPGIHWTRPVLVAEIEFAGWTGDGHLRQAAYKGLREDKPARAIKQERSAAAAPARDAPGAAAVVLTHAHKALWPATDATATVDKEMLARYYTRFAPRLLAHIAGRPCSLVRCPDGIDGQRFFQRHAMRGASPLLELLAVGGARKPYLVINRAEALVALAQMAAVELHPWNCLPGIPDEPGRLVFDLDPAPGLPFSDVIAAAREVRARLDAVGLESFCKTTGGKGLHVVAPLVASRRDALDWPTAKHFCRSLCAAMAADAPARYVVNMSKRQREGRIFLDYLRNDRMATAVAPWSPRARPGAPVAMPLAWRALNARLDPQRYTLGALLARMPRDPWQDYDAAAGCLRAALRRLAKG